jgi:hypothetical protein
MATLVTKTSGDVAREVRIHSDEVRAMIREKFPDIPENAVMSVAIDGISEVLEEVTLSWTSRTRDAQEIDLVPEVPKCKRPSERVLNTLPAPGRLAEIAEREATE